MVLSEGGSNTLLQGPSRLILPFAMKDLLIDLDGIPKLLVLGSKDECYPTGMDAESLGQRLAMAAGAPTTLKILPGDHCLSGVEEEFIEHVMVFLNELP